MLFSILRDYQQKKAAKTGRHAEKIAEAYLQAQGLSSVHRNWRCRQGEIDLIMMDNDTLVFVEVRLRSSAHTGGAAESITSRKQRKISHAAQHFLYAHHCDNLACRFDAVLLDALSAESVTWLRDAF